MLGDPGSKVDPVWQVAVVGHHHIVQVLAFQAAAPPCGYEGVYLRTRVDGDQGHCACISQSCSDVLQVAARLPQ